MNMSRYAFIIPVTKNYLHEARPLVKSLFKHNPATDIHIISTEANQPNALDGTEFDDLGKIIFFRAPKADTEFRQVRTSRFRYAADIGAADPGYEVVALLDADMLCIRNLDKFFRMASTGTIIASSNNTLLRYQKKDFDKMHVQAPASIDVVHPTICTVPIFINPNIHRPFLMEVFNNATGNDLDVPNLLLESMGLMQDHVFLVNSYAWTNIHHSMLKPETFIMHTQGGLYSKQGEPVYMLHGHWYDDRYINDLMEPMIKHYGYCQKYIDTARNCIATIKRIYDEYKC